MMNQFLVYQCQAVSYQPQDIGKDQSRVLLTRHYFDDLSWLGLI